MSFATSVEFKQFLDGARVALIGKRASTHRVTRHGPRAEAANLSWWRSTGRSDGLSQESRNRNRTYLISYFEAAGPALPAVGFRFRMVATSGPIGRLLTAPCVMDTSRSTGKRAASS